VVDPVKAARFLSNLTRAEQKKAEISDYDRSLIKSFQKRKKAERAERLAKSTTKPVSPKSKVKPASPRSKVKPVTPKSKRSTIPQLGEQPEQRLTKLPDEHELRIQRQMRETGLSREVLTGQASPPKAEVTRWHFELGKPFVPPDDVKKLQTKMYLFNGWYMVQASKGRKMFGCRVKDEDFFNGEETIWLEFRDIHEIYQRDALDISLIQIWVL